MRWQLPEATVELLVNGSQCAVVVEIHIKIQGATEVLWHIVTAVGDLNQY